MADGAATPSRPIIHTLQSSNGADRAAILRAQMERSASKGIREEGRELRQAADESLNVILDLALDGTIRRVSPTWPDVVGTNIEDVQDKPIQDIVVDAPTTFPDAVDALRRDDAGSKVIRFSVLAGPKSRFAGTEDDAGTPQELDEDTAMSRDSNILDLEAQGIMVYDRTTGAESHVSTDPDPRER